MGREIKFIVLVFLALFCVGVSAQSAGEQGFCVSSVPTSVLEENPLLSLSYTDDCNCWDFTPAVTEWRKNFCLGGMMLEERTVQDLIKPECSQSYVYYEEQESFNDLCRLCSDPSGYSDWETVSCYENGVLKKRTAFNACWLDPITDEKKYSDKTQFAFFKGGKCDTSIFSILPAVIVLIFVFILLAYIIKRSRTEKKRKKGTPFVGYVLILIGISLLLLLLFPQTFALFAILPPGTTGSGALGVKWAVSNTLVMENNPLDLKFAFLGADGSLKNFIRLSLGETNEIIGNCVSERYCGEVYGFSCYGGSGIYVPYNPRSCQIPIESFRGLDGKVVVRVMSRTCDSAHYNCDIVTETDWQYINDFEVWVDSSKCVLQPGYFWVIEQFEGGRTITKDDLRFRPSAFCARKPIFVYEMGSIVEQKVEEMALLENSYITIPAGQLWEISYIVNENDAPGLMIDCGVYGEDVVYDADLDVCVKTPIVVTVCSGTLTPGGECIKQTTTRCVDENGMPVEGAFYDVGNDVCVKVIPTQLQLVPADCPSNSTVVVGVDGIKKCVFPPKYDCDGRLDFSTHPPTCFGFVDYELVISVSPIVKIAGWIISVSFIVVGLYLVLKR